MVFDCAVILLEHAAPRNNSGIEVVDAFQMLVDERLIDERPEALGGLQFRACRLIEEPDALWNWKIFRAMPAGIIKLRDDDAIAAAEDRCSVCVVSPPARQRSMTRGASSTGIGGSMAASNGGLGRVAVCR